MLMLDSPFYTNCIMHLRIPMMISDAINLRAARSELNSQEQSSPGLYLSQMKRTYFKYMIKYKTRLPMSQVLLSA
jgi:hypothetical protein